MQPAETREHRGFTLIDLLVTMTVLVVLAGVILPRIQDDARLRLIGASRMLASDIELAQLMTIANPQEPTVLRLQAGTGEYWLAPASTPDTPIDRSGVPGGYRVIFGQGDARHAAGVTIATVDIPNDTLIFNAQGGIADLTTEPAVIVMVGTRWIKLEISPTTGSISESSDAD
jgi:prepilin-type N-terminal cleavage/methylation domain-containing protein